MKNYSEECNPYINIYENISLKISEIISENKKLTNDINWYKLKNKEDFNQNIELLVKKIKAKNEEIKEIQNIKLVRKGKQNALKNEIKSYFNPLYYFSNIQKGLRKEFDIIEDSINNLNIIIASRLEVIKKLEVRKDKFQSEDKRYDSLNFSECQEKIKNNDLILIKLDKKLNTIIKQKNKVGKQLEPIIKELERVDIEIEKVNSIINKAEYYINSLNNANNSRQRAIIHQYCENELGDGQPNRIIKNKKELIKKHQRDLNKLLIRAEKISNKASRTIDIVIIDGNNMSYEANKFIGLKALIPMTTILDENYEVIVIFDSEIRNMLKMNDLNISKQFKDSIKIHIVASKQKADETILDLASENSNNYVISNDRFSDYFDKEAVANKRILSHEIINSIILIHDLDIKLTF